MGKCLKDVQEAMLKVDLWGLLGDSRGGSRDIKDMRITSVSKKRNSLTSERGHM